MPPEDIRIAGTALAKTTSSLTTDVRQERFKATMVIEGIRKKVSKFCRDLTEAKSWTLDRTPPCNHEKTEANEGRSWPHRPPHPHMTA